MIIIHNILTSVSVQMIIIHNILTTVSVQMFKIYKKNITNIQCFYIAIFSSALELYVFWWIKKFCIQWAPIYGLYTPVGFFFLSLCLKHMYAHNSGRTETEVTKHFKSVTMREPFEWLPKIFSLLTTSSSSSSLSSVLVLLTSKTMSFLGSTRTKLWHSKVKWPAKENNGWWKRENQCHMDEKQWQKHICYPGAQKQC